MRCWVLIACLITQGAAAGEPLTLERALALARERNEVPAIARARIERAAALTRQAWARLLPEAMIQGRYTRRQAAVSRQVGGDVAEIQSRNALNATATVQTNVLDASAIPLVISARREEEATAHEAESLVQSLSYDVATGFFAVLSAEELHAAAERRVQVAASAVEVSQRRVKAGLSGRQEVTRTELSLSNARLALNDARLLVETTRLALGELLALTVDMPLAPPPPLPERAPDEEALGTSRRPDLLALESRSRSFELLALEPHLRLIPSLGIGAEYRITNEPGFGLPTNWSLFATSTWVLYDGGLRYAQARARAAEADELRLTLSSLRRTAEREHAEASVRIVAAQAALDEARIAHRLAQENVEQVSQLFAAGLATALERDDATVAAFEAQADLAQSTFALRVAQLEERRARGLWPLGEDG